MSSICMEAISLNIPLIILSKNESINVSIVPNNINKKMFKRYFSSKGLLRLLKFYLYNYDAKENEKLSLSYYKDFFYEINSENSNKFVT